MGSASAPGQLIRVWIRIQAARAGKFFARAHVVRCRRHGSATAAHPTDYEGSVSRQAPFMPRTRLPGLRRATALSGAVPGARHDWL
jgi:hypothetical protein